MVVVFRSVRRVLKDDGTLWLNLGDSYNGSGGAGGDYSPGGLKEGQPKYPGRNEKSLKPKDLMMIPARVALALQADGWWLRSEIIWHKPNPMPESVTDRPTKSHEMIYLLAKSAKYFYDAEAIKEPSKDPIDDRGARTAEEHKRFPTEKVNGIRASGVYPTRNKRDVWTVTTKPYKEAHFATFPEALPERCIKAATPEVGCCAKCGAPWERVIEKGLTAHDGETKSQYDKGTTANRLALLRQAARSRGEEYASNNKTIGWRPTCSCGTEEKVPSLVLDCFAGSGTTLWVAKKLGRRSVGYEISEEYCALAQERNRQGSLL